VIHKITKKEYKRLEGLQKNKFYSDIIFKLKDGSTYRCDVLGAPGLKEIQQFRRVKKDIADRQLDLLGIPVVSSK
jgi:hypothetical protein